MSNAEREHTRAIISVYNKFKGRTWKFLQQFSTEQLQKYYERLEDIGEV